MRKLLWQHQSFQYGANSVNSIRVLCNIQIAEYEVYIWGTEENEGKPVDEETQHEHPKISLKIEN